MSTVQSLACGWTHTILVSDRGRIYGWGIGESGQLGSEKGFVKFTATQLNLGSSVTEREDNMVSVGSHHSCILSNGSVYTMGSAQRGRLGHDKTHGVVVFPNREQHISYVASGSDFNIAIGSGGYNLYAWGMGTYGNLGDGDREDRFVPVVVNIFDPFTQEKKKVVRVSCGSRHTLALCEGGDVFSWGFGANGRLGHGDVESYLEPKRIDAFVLSEDQLVVDVAAGDSHSMARTKDGRIYTWGSGSYGRLGLGTENDMFTPKQVTALKNCECLHIACSTFHCLAVVDPAGGQFSSLYSWGGGKYGKLGLGTQDNHYTPQEVPFFKRKNRRVVQCSAGLQHTVAVTSKGKVFAWGYAARFRCGIPAEGRLFFDTPRHIPFFDREDVVNRVVVDRQHNAKLIKALPKGLMVAAGEGHSMALTDPDGQVLVWGENSQGQLGTGFHTCSYKPIVVTRLAKQQIVSIACGARHSLCVDKWGGVYAWGANDAGQLGIGNKETMYYPELIKALQGTKITSVIAGDVHSGAIEGHWDDERVRQNDSAHTVVSVAYLWGSNASGQLGLPREVPQKLLPEPVHLPVRQGYNRVELALGYQHTLLLCTNYSPPAQRDQGLIRRAKQSTVDMNSALEIAKIKETHVYVTGSNSEGQLGLRNVAASKCVYEFRRLMNYKDEALIMSKAETGYSREFGDPLIKHVYAGPRCSFAVTYSMRIEQLFAWGYVVGLDPPRMLNPRIVDDFSGDTIQQNLGINQTVHHLEIEQIASALGHFVAVLKFNNDRRVVFAWGETKYGKLGVGNIAKFTETLKERAHHVERLKSALTDMDTAGDGAAVTTVTYLSPAQIRNFDDQDIQLVACGGEHNLAISKIGSVYAWGYGRAGRLGFGEETSATKSLQEPMEVPSFYYPKAQGLEEESKAQNGDGDGGGGDDSDGEGDSGSDSGDDDDDDEFGAGSGGRRRGRKSGKDGLAAGDGTIGGVDGGGGGGGGGGVGGGSVELGGGIDGGGKTTGRGGRGGRAAQDFGDYEDEDDEHAVKLSTKHLPRERFAVIQYATELLGKKAEEYVSVMATYLKNLDELDSNEDIIQLAVDRRVEQARTSNLGLREPLAIDDGAGKQQSRKARRRKKIVRKGDYHVVLPSSHQLEPFEEVIGRFYMAPCLFVDLYDNCSVYLRDKTLFDEAEEALKSDFYTLLFRVYDLHFKQDRRLLEVFLQHMMERHINQCRTPDEILNPDSLEWRIFYGIFRHGKIRAKIRDMWVKPLADLAQVYNVRDPCQNLFEYMATPDEAEGKVEESIKTLVFMTDKLFEDLTDKSVSVVLGLLGWLVEIMVNAFEKLARPVHQVIGKRLVRALALSALDDMDSRRHRDAGRLGGEMGQKRISVFQERFIFSLLMGVEEARDHLETQYNIVEDELIPDSLDEFWAMDPVTFEYSDPGKMRQLDAFETYWRVTNQREQKMQSLDRAFEKERLVLRDYLVNRSIYRPRLVQIPHTSRSLLMLFEYVDDNPAILHGSANMRLDPFSTDSQAPTEKCKRCGVFHPPVVYPNAAADEDEVDDGLAAMEESLDIKKRVVLSSRVCTELWRTLKEKEFQEVVETKAGEGAWKALMRLLKAKRHKSFEKKLHNLVETYEEASRYLRSIKDAPQGTMVYLGDSQVPAVQEMIDPARLFQRLREIDASSERDEIRAIRNVELFIGVVAQMKRAAAASQDAVNEARETFNVLTGQGIDHELQQFKGDYKDSGVTSTLKTFKRIHVYKERGTIRVFTWSKLRKMGVLDDDPEDKTNNPEKIFCLPIHWLTFLRTSMMVKNQIEFLTKLRFFFITTDSDDLFEIKLVYDTQLLVHALVSIAVINNGDLVKRRVAFSRGVLEDCHIIRYIPQGDKVPVTRAQTFWFEHEPLTELLQSLPRPHLRHSAGDQATYRGTDLSHTLQVTMDV